MNSLPTPAGRDPVAEAIERLLRDMEAEGKGTFTQQNGHDSVKTGFGAKRAEGPTYDIALVRLANAMIDDPQYASLICDTLRAVAVPRRQ